MGRSPLSAALSLAGSVSGRLLRPLAGLLSLWAIAGVIALTAMAVRLLLEGRALGVVLSLFSGNALQMLFAAVAVAFWAAVAVHMLACVKRMV